MKTKKTLSIKIDAVTYTATSAVLCLTDNAGEYDHPSLKLTLSSSDKSLSEDVFVKITAQRHRTKCGEYHVAEGYMDTTRTWSACYGVRIELGRDSDSVSISPVAGTRTTSDRARIAVAKRIAKEIDRKNLSHVERGCEMRQAVAALESIGVYVEKMYGSISLGEVPLAYRGANRKAKVLAAAASSTLAWPPN
jgi:hypothetical protein